MIQSVSIFNNKEETSNDKEPTYKAVGLVNNNNNCYMNSVLQCLLNIPTFVKVLKSCGSVNNQVFKQLILLEESIAKLRKSEQGPAEIKSFLMAVRRENELFNNDYHHDAPEFLFWLLDFLHESCTQQSKSGSVFSSLLHGTQFSITKCLNCEMRFNREESYLSLAVEVQSNVSLTSCLRKYIGKEIMKNKDKYYCDCCNALHEAEKR